MVKTLVKCYSYLRIQNELNISSVNVILKYKIHKKDDTANAQYLVVVARTAILRLLLFMN